MPVEYAQYAGGRLRPFSQPTAEAWEDRFSEFEVVEVKTRSKRNAKFNALYHSLVQYTAKALKENGEAVTHDDIHKKIKRRLGYYEIVELDETTAAKVGLTHVISYTSTAFGKMSEEAFREFVELAFDAIETEICPYLMQSEWAARIDSILTEFRR